MKLFLTALFFSLLSTLAFADGSQGQYYIVGTAYGADSVSLKNVSLVVKFGKETKTIKTNEQGWFEIEVKWATPCRSGLSTKQINEQKAQLNPEYIYVTYKGKELKIKNTWEKYTSITETTIKKRHDLLY